MKTFFRCTLALFLVFCQATWAAKMPQSIEKMTKEAHLIVSGTIVEIEKKAGPITIKLKVESISKGSGIKKGDTLVVSTWSSKLKPPPKPDDLEGFLALAGLQGLDPIPKKGEKVTAYLLKNGKADYKPILPNGIISK